MDNQFSAMLYEKSVLGTQCVRELFKAQDSLITLQKNINYTFKNLDLLFQAFTHRSFVHEYTREKLRNYERLEFLGDSVLGSYVALKLYSIFDEEKEGVLSKIKSSLVNETKLASIGKGLELQSMILLGKGELALGPTDSVISDVFEAVIGAISLDASNDVAFKTLDYIIGEFEKKNEITFFDANNASVFDPKTTLQEETMRRFKVLPEYLSSKNGEEFLVSVSVCGVKLHELTNISKKRAMKELAKYCLENNLLEQIKN
ncbi:ribonuclease III family protein [Bacteriovorax sp. Seq25_V]|uniref:ribonuclease III family protein n=1 Tax=Bacteriovorax sp. Seq25_V TaxID=1201288 RepID=UPI0009FCABDE|nr:ribonuclease III domain-containing protein [Bacteriovorax sp. Seq25_V]